MPVISGVAHSAAPQDFDGTDLSGLLQFAAIEGAPTVATVLPSFHGIGSTRSCIDLRNPTPRQYWRRGQSDGIWLSHKLFRDTGNWSSFRRRSQMLDPCSKLARLAAKGTPLAPGTSPAHFTLRRNVASRQGSVLALGESANLDFNRYTGCAPNLTRFGCTFSAPFAGAFLPDPTREHWVDIISAAPPFKYCRKIPLGSAEAPRRRIPGVAVLLPELHANINVGHAVKDLVFFAHILAEQASAKRTDRSFVISTVLIDDGALATGNISHGIQDGFGHRVPHSHGGFAHRRASIEALVQGTKPPVHVAFLQQGALPHKEDFGHEAPWAGASSVCFDLMLQKGFAFAGDSRGASLYRDRVYAYCDIPLRAAPDTVLIGVHGLASHGKTTRRWHDQQSLVDSVRARMNGTRWCRRGRGALVDGSAAMESNGCKPLRVMVSSMEGLSFCEQASLYARSKVVFVHHGASLANGLFLRRDSLMVELNKQWAVEPPDTVPTHSVPRFAHTFDGAGYSLLFISSGVAYVGARVTYGVWPKGTSGGYNEGGADPMTGAVQWHMRQKVVYDFNDARMEIAINSSRWLTVLDEVEHMMTTLGRRRAAAHGKQMRELGNG